MAGILFLNFYDEFHDLLKNLSIKLGFSKCSKTPIIDKIFDVYTGAYDSEEYKSFLASKNLDEDDHLGGAAGALEYRGTEDYARQYDTARKKAMDEIWADPYYYAGSMISEVGSFFIPATKAGLSF